MESIVWMTIDSLPLAELGSVSLLMKLSTEELISCLALGGHLVLVSKGDLWGNP